MKKLEGTIKVVGGKCGWETKIFVVPEDGTGIDISGAVKKVVYTVNADGLSIVELTTYPDKVEVIAGVNIITFVEGDDGAKKDS